MLYYPEHGHFSNNVYMYFKENTHMLLHSMLLLMWLILIGLYFIECDNFVTLLWNSNRWLLNCQSNQARGSVKYQNYPFWLDNCHSMLETCIENLISQRFCDRLSVWTWLKFEFVYLMVTTNYTNDSLKEIISSKFNVKMRVRKIRKLLLMLTSVHHSFAREYFVNCEFKFVKTLRSSLRKVTGAVEKLEIKSTPLGN